MNIIVYLINISINNNNNNNYNSNIDQFINNNNNINKNQIVNDFIETLEIIKSIQQQSDDEFKNIFSNNKSDTLEILCNIFKAIYCNNENNNEFVISISNGFTSNQLVDLLNPIKQISNIIIEINENSIQGFIKIEEMLPQTFLLKFIKFIIQDLATIGINDGNRGDETILVYIKLVKIFWNNNQLSLIEKSIQEMFSIILDNNNNNNNSDNISNEITGSIINILNISPIELIPLFINIIDNGRVQDSDLLEVISKLTKWPLTFTNSKWILETFISLIKSKKTTLLASIVIECAESITRQMFILELLPNAYEILERMLLGYQHSPDTFHSIIPLFPIIIEFLFTFYNKIKGIEDNSSITIDLVPIVKSDIQQSVRKILSINGGENGSSLRKDLLVFSIKRVVQPARFKKSIYTTLNKFSKLSWTLMYHHTGYPELYSDLIQLLHRLSPHLDPVPSEFEMKKLLEENAWPSLDSLVFENIKLKRVLSDRAGLINLGNTCYMNSFLQALYMTIPFRNLLLQKIDQDLINSIKSQFITNVSTGDNEENVKLMEQKYSKEIFKRAPLLKQIQIVFANLRLSIKESISPDSFLKCLSIEYQSGLQHDSFEFGKSLLDNLDLIFKNINKEKVLEFERNQKKQKLINDSSENKNTNSTNTENYSSEISKLFGGKLSNKITCRKCKNESIKIEEYLEIPLAFSDYKKENYTLEEMVQDYLSNEELVGDNKYHCEKCKSLEEADKIIKLNSTPQHLILGINRFYFSRESKSISKLLNNVDYPLEFNLPYTPNNNNNNDSDTNNNNTDNQDKPKYSNYSLYAIIMHSGRSPNHGHYYCYAKPSNSKQLDWCLFNDSLVQISDIKTIQKISKSFSTDVPYILFYVRNDTNDIEENTDMNVTTWIKNQIDKENQLLHNKYKQNLNNKKLLLEQFHVSGQFKND
ncbi:hypothetical protein DICPUDRAFT_159531 [Dictyostelium purpureum]|uniref:Ubiquitin carboxyl-terminal hydrolase n=1 Tax=Dictyostelium purpureum TaxID=5786 RepID=F1A4C9_DICPU|nr:uncharacterized protein DICPUDRAFT_159531 [Dictyostelium purpureum]EGC28953.1 hypothetical protein DICPUDRAFT_159531 [Dictyostelium purpureum]|eukprot:XP_003294523.1 hypothetical protein DICPUDRAFT_159531 [Dictyostelium purpureum]